MSEQDNQQPAAVETIPAKAFTVEMTAEDFQQWERNVQLGVTDKMPDGRKLSEVHKELTDLQIAQATERAVVSEEDHVRVDDANAVPNEVKPETLMEVVVQPNGVVSATPKVEASEAAAIQTDGNESDQEPANDLPKDYPSRKALLAAGFTSLETVAKFTVEDLIGIPGIKQASAERILNYGKSGE